MNSSSPVEVQTGTLNLTRGGTSSGNFTVSSGTVLHFGGGTHTITLGDGESISAAGTVRFSAGTTSIGGAGDYNVTGNTEVTGGMVNFNGSAATVNALLSGGTLGGSGTLSVTGNLDWTGGNFGGSGNLEIANTATFNIGGSTNGRTLNTRTLNNAGTTVFDATSTISAGQGAVFNNQVGALFDMKSNAVFNYTTAGGVPQFNNLGTLRKSAGTGTSTITVNLANSQDVEILTGTLSFTRDFTQTSGSTTLSGGNLTSSQTIDIQGGVLGGSGLITGSITNAGEVSPGSSAGNLDIVGNYTQTADGVLNIEIGGPTAGTEFDLLDVTGVVNLDGTLTVSLIGGFTPTASDSYAIIPNPTAVNGDFAQKEFPAPTGRDFYSVSLGPSVTVNLSVIMTYEDWSGVHFTNDELSMSTISGTDADPDNDGLVNLLEYLLGTDPRDPAAPNPFFADIILDSSELFLTFSFPWAGDVTDYDYVVQSSVDLLNWDPANLDAQLITTPQGPGIDLLTVRIMDPIDNQSNLFLRLLVNLIP